MNCKEAIDLAEEAMDKDLPRAVKRRLDLHLSRCESCRRFFEAERAEHVRWFRVFNDPSAMRRLPPGFANRLAASARRPRHGFWFRLPRWLKRVACFAALLSGAAFAATVVVDAVVGADSEATVERIDPNAPQTTEATDGSAALAAPVEVVSAVPYVPDVASVPSGENQPSTDNQLENEEGETKMNIKQKAAMETPDDGGISMRLRQFVDTVKIATLAALTVSAAPSAQAEDAYIESDGTTVVNSGVMPSDDLRVEIDYAFTSIKNDTRLFGVYVAGEQSAEYYINQTGGLAFHVGKGWVGGTYLTMPDTKRHMIVFDIPAGKVHSVTGTTTNKTESMKSSPGLSAIGTAPIGLFGRINNANGSSDDNNLRTKARIYGAKFYKGGTLVKNLVPFVKGDAAGFRDTVSGTFITGEVNVSGLSAGGNVERIADDGYIELTGNDSTKAAENRGGHFINTGYTPGVNTRIEFDYAFAANREGSGDWYALCAGNTGATNAMALYGTDSSLRVCIGSNLWMNTTMPAPTNMCYVRRTLILDAPNSAVTLLTAGYPNFARTNSVPWVPSAMSTTLRLGEDPGGSGWGFSPIRIYGLKIYESGSLVREYVPYVKNGAPGLKYGDTFVNVSCNAPNGKVGLPRAGGNVDVSSERDHDAYVLFSGVQNIDTGYVPNGKTKIVADFGFANVHNNPQQILFDASNGLYCRLYTQNGAGTDARYSWLFNSAWGVLHSGIAVDHQRRLLTIDSPNNQTCFAPGATEGSTYNGDSTIRGWNRNASSSHSLVLGSLAVPDASKGYLYAKARFYRFTIYDGGEKVREFVPYTANGASGLYDIVSNEVFAAAGLTVGGRGYNGAEEWLITPQSCTLTKNEERKTLKAQAVGAIRYKWTKNGTEILDVSDGELTITWVKGGAEDAYTVTPVYDVFGTETDGAAVPFTIKNRPQGLVISVL